MNVYIVVEGKQTERKLYPSWIEHLAPFMKKISIPSDATNDSFYLVSGEGYPNMYNTVLLSLRDIEQYQQYTHLWVVLDADTRNPDDVKNEVFDFIKKSIEAENINIGLCEIRIIVQTPCIETWGLGNKYVLSYNQLHDGFGEFVEHYDVKINDPEKMLPLNDFDGSIAAFHELYLKKCLVFKISLIRKKTQED